jgi:hypothetical protein
VTTTHDPTVALALEAHIASVAHEIMELPLV